jgi:hypothetical protein
MYESHIEKCMHGLLGAFMKEGQEPCLGYGQGWLVGQV